MKYRNWKIPYTAPQPPEALLRAGYSPLLAVLLAASLAVAWQFIFGKRKEGK